MEKVEGIIIKSNKYLENSKIIYCLTTNGIKSFLVKGASKLTCKNNAISQSVTNVNIEYAKGKGFDIVTGGSVIDNYLNIKNDYERMQTVYLVLELTYNFSEHVTNRELFYNFTKETLENIDIMSHKHFKYYYCVYALKLLYLLGVGPSFSKCINCGTSNDLAGFVLNSGGMICTKCHNDGAPLYNSTTVKMVKTLYLLKNDKFNDELFAVMNYNDIMNFIEHYYERFLGFTSKTKVVVSNLNK